MGKISTAKANALLDFIFGAGSNALAPATYYVGLSLTPPGDDGSGITEPSGGGYARVSVTNNATNFPAASGRLKSNGTTVTFPTASGTWGSCTHFFLSDAATSGTFQGWGALTTTQTITTGGAPNFPSGSLVLDA